MSSQKQDQPQLAILIGAPHGDQISMHHDLTAFHAALRRRGLATDEIVALEGKLDRGILLGFLHEISRRIAGWEQGALLLLVSGHGFFLGDTAIEARVGIELQPAASYSHDLHVLWDEIFRALSLPAHVTLTLVPDH